MAIKKKYINKSKKSSNKNFKLKSVFSTICITVMTVVLTKALDSLFPSKVSFSEVPVEHINIEHSFDFGTYSSDSAINRRIMDLAKIEELENKIDKKTTQKPNEIIHDNLSINAKGYSLMNSRAYCSVDIVNSNNGTMDCILSFFDPSIVKDVCFVGVKICRINDDGKKSYVTDCNYKPKDINIMRFSNSFPSGIYSFEIGFTFKKDIEDKYPTFYYQSLNYRF